MDSACGGFLPSKARSAPDDSAGKRALPIRLSLEGEYFHIGVQIPPNPSAQTGPIFHRDRSSPRRIAGRGARGESPAFPQTPHAPPDQRSPESQSRFPAHTGSRASSRLCGICIHTANSFRPVPQFVPFHTPLQWRNGIPAKPRTGRRRASPAERTESALLCT